MKTLQSYLKEIRDNPKKGWSTAYRDILDETLGQESVFLKSVEMFGEAIMFEAMLITSQQKLSSHSNKLAYVLTVARNLWKEDLQNALEKDELELRLERAKNRVSGENADLAEKIEKAKRRLNATDSI